MISSLSKKSLHLWQRRQWVGPSSSSATRAGSFSQGASEGDAVPVSYTHLDVYKRQIVDIMMPGIDGFELCVRMRQMRDIPVIFLSAKDEEADQVVGFTPVSYTHLKRPHFLGEELS